MTEVAVVRWVFADPETGESITVPVNPNKMSSIEPTRNIRTASGTRRLQNRIRTMARPPSITEMSFSGVVFTEEHYNLLNEWSRKSGPVHITDHLGRTVEVLMKAFDPKDRKPRPDKLWRFTYEMRALILRRVS